MKPRTAKRAEHVARKGAMRHANEISLRVLGLEQNNFKWGFEYCAVEASMCTADGGLSSLLTF